MKIRLMQLIDYWVGVPLCCLLSVYQRVNLLFRPAAIKPTKKILFIELSEMGSAVIAYSALANAVCQYGRENIYFLIFKINSESVEILNVLPKKNILTIDSRNFFAFVFSSWRMLLKVRSLAIDTVIDMELFSRFTMLFSYMSGAGKRIGFDNYTAEGLYRGKLLTHPVFYNHHQHMQINFIALFQAAVNYQNSQPQIKENVLSSLIDLPLFVPPAETASAALDLLKASGVGRQALLEKKVIIFNPDPGTALPIRGWPAESYTQLAKMILQQWPDYYLVVVGLKGAQKYYQALASELNAKAIIDLTGRTNTLADLLAVVNNAALIVGNDSGPAHFASLIKVDSLVLFGPETPNLYRPLGDKVRIFYAGLCCSPCLSAANHRHTICKNNKCLQAIGAAEVFAVIKECIEKRENKH
ncbi:MAG: glycosyltransferase family 9 protein [Deltaproteobacteria bacterium]|nr:glycosyltransferase family 9 protein [Deltaproteobacteria bacterium]